MTVGYNYANVWDKQSNTFSEEKAVSLGLKARPESYDISYSSLMKQSDNIEFGDVRMVVEWIVMDIPDWQELIKADN